MKKIIKTGIIVSLSSISILASAEYIMKIPVDADIRFVPANKSAPEETETPVQQEPVVEETWATTDPVISEWANSGEPYDCSEWLPSTNTFSTGKEFTQSAECKQNQTRTVQYYETSNTGETRKVGGETTETQVITTNEERTALGTRYTHVLNVGHYYVWSDNYYGYFSPSYVANSSAVTHTYGNMTPSTFKGYTIDHLVEQTNKVITFRLLPVHTSPSINPTVTINGEDCYLTGPNQYSAYNGYCNFELNSKIGQTLHLDIR